MSSSENRTLDSTEAAFRSLQSLLAAAHRNAILMGGDRSRLQIGAGYLRLAAQQAVALADLVQAIGDIDHPRAERAESLFAQIKRDMDRYVAVVADEEESTASAAAAVSVIARREEALQRLIRL